MWDLRFLGQIDYRTIEHPWIINEIYVQTMYLRLLLLFQCIYFILGTQRHYLIQYSVKDFLFGVRQKKYSQRDRLKIILGSLNIIPYYFEHYATFEYRIDE